LAGVDFVAKSGATELTYTEQRFFLDADYGSESRAEGSSGLLKQFESYLKTLR